MNENQTPVSCEICQHEWTTIKGNEETEPCPGCHDAPLSVNAEATEPERTEYSTAIQTLTSMGYEWFGGSLWKPPIGPIPDFILNTKPEWIDGLPPVGEVCEWCYGDTTGASPMYGKVTMIGMREDYHVLYLHKSEKYQEVYDPARFRPIPDKKQQVIDNTIESIEYDSYLADLKGLSLREMYRSVLSDAYDAGMLIDPDKENK